MTIEEIFNKCILDYPVGGSYRSVLDSNIYVLTEKLNLSSYLSISGNFTIYYNGKYAEIISLPENYVKDNHCEIY